MRGFLVNLYIVIWSFFFAARTYSLIFCGAEFFCLHCPAVVGTVEMGAGGCSTRKKIQASRTKFWVRSFVEKSVPPMRGLCSADWGKNRPLSLGLYIKVSVVGSFFSFE